MARERWLALSGCLALLGLLPACNRCLNPQPEPPDPGCGQPEPPFGGRGAGGANPGAFADAGFRSADAGPDATDPSDVGADREPDRAATSDDVLEDATPKASTDVEDEAPADAADDVSDADPGDASSDAEDELPDAVGDSEEDDPG